MNEVIRLRLIGDLIEALQNKKRPHSNLDHLYVHFYTKRGRFIGDLEVAHALDCLWNDVHRFENFDLIEADRLELQVH